MSQEEIMRVLDKHKGCFLTAKQIKKELPSNLNMRSVFRALTKITSWEHYEEMLFFDRGNRTSTNAVTKYRAKNEED